MSLQVWLPFTDGTLKQQGLNSETVTSGGTIDLTDAGKLGKCATFGSAAGGITIPASTMTSFTNCSVAFWLKINDWGSSYDTYFQAGTGSTPWNNYIFGFLRNNTNSTICFTISNGSAASNANYLTSALSINTWYHIALTYETGKCKIYLNGALDHEYSTTIVPAFDKITKITLGRSNNDSSYQTQCSINDFRIYDHTLSQMEVKEVSKGLVLHYPLNRGGWGQENLVWNSNWNLRSTNPPENWTNWGSPPTREIVTIDGKNWLHVISNTTTFQGYSQNWTKRNGVGELSAGQKITVSFTAYLAVAASIAPIGIHWCNSSGTIISQNWTTTALTTNPKRYSFTYTTPADCVAFNIMVGDGTNTAHEVWITDIKLEFGQTATPWCPNSSDALAATMGLNRTTEYDCSGFCNNGTLWAYDTGGAITYTSDTPKYQVSTYINSDNNTTNTASGSRYIYGNCELTAPKYLTVAFWCKPIAGYGSSTGQGQFSLTNNAIGASAGQDYDTCPMNHRDSVIDMCTSSGTHKTVSIAFTANEWHHYVIVYDGRYGRVYKDGVATGATLDMGSVLPLKDMKGAVIGFSKAGGVWRSNKSYFSDFRIYATALSADDVKSLYQNSAYIDSNGNVYGAVHSEV